MGFRKTNLFLALTISLIAAFSASAADKPVKVNFWHIGTAATDKGYYQGVADAFMKANPNVTIEMTILENEAFKSKLTTVMQSGNPPDIFHSWGGGVLAEYAKAGLLRDITKFTKGTAWGKSMAPGVWDIYAYNGKQYGAPFDMGAITFWYNKDLLAKVGYTSFPAEWSDFLNLVKKLKAAGIVPIALGGGDKWPAMHMWTYLAARVGGKEVLVNAAQGKGKGFNDPAFVKAGEMLVELVKLGAFQDGFLGATYPDEAALVGNGVAAMELMGQWAPNVQVDSSVSKKGIGDSLAAAPVPAVAKGKGKVTDVVGGGNGMAVGKNAPDAAVEFLKFLTNVENNAEYARVAGIIPTVKGAEVGIPSNNGKMVKQIVDKTEFFQLYLDQFFSPAVGGAVNDAVQTILAGTATPAQACKAIQSTFEMEQ
ncbi:extracellular solute-binding protein [Treponema zuelzerae]|uniref:Extracellular solute-binding protein n=1 Tax=Teretinema zuelzerae TaxID=156 RepID=A0AAE3EIH2_9SPIR|nr:extracellular solute-binding protein [Teretinema zuelzerae]MCD1655036.1 extracellular solute-binding protein [Teretinema zuelzerae]